MASTAIIIGTAATCERIERQLNLVADRPVSLGWVLVDAETTAPAGDVLGSLDQLEAIIARRRPGMALVSLPAVMSALVSGIRTRLRRMGVPDRFMPTLEDQLAGIGPRTQLDVDVTQLLARPAKTMDEQAIRQAVGSRTILITGAGGSIGSELARIVARFDPEHLVLMDRSENALFEIDRQIARSVPELSRRAILHDVVDAATTMKLMRSIQPQVIFHAAAHKHVPMMEDHPAAAVENNVYGTRSVADAADAVGAERFVLISTDKAVNPTSIMGATKRLAELYVQHLNQQSKTGYSVVRFGNVLGSTGSVLEIWSKQIADGGPMTVTDPAMTRYFMTIPEAAALVIQSAALHNPRSGGEVFVLDMGEPIRIIDLAKRVASMYGLTAILPEEAVESVEHGSIRIVQTGIRPGEKLHEELAFDTESLWPTRHPDINIWCLEPPDCRYIEHMFKVLKSCRGSSAAGVASAVRGLLEPGIEACEASVAVAALGT